MAAMFTECHVGWKAQPDMSGGYEIVERHGWTLATVNYDYRFTCNATNLSRANMIAAAPEMHAVLARMVEDHENLDANLPLRIYNAAKAALAKARGEH